MLIQSKIKRNPGTFVTMKDGTRYAFMPNDADDHVAEVEIPAHIERFLSIPEGFGVYSPGEVIPADIVKEALAQTGEGGGAHEPVPVITEPSATTPAPAGDTSPPAHPYPDPAPQEPMPLEHMTLTDLQATYERELRKKPHHRAGPEKLIEDINAHRAAQE